MKKAIIIVFVILLTAFGVYLFQKEEKVDFTLAEVSRGAIYQEVLETGTVKKGEEIALGFKDSGRIEKIYVEVGDIIEEGILLAKLDASQLQIQLKAAEADLSLVQIKLDKLLAGASSEEIKIAETAVNNAKTSLEAVRQNLKDVEADTKEDLNNAYEDALNILDDSYLKIYNALNCVDLIQRTYFYSNDQEGIKVRESKDKIQTGESEAKSILDIAKNDLKNENIENALSEIQKILDTISKALADIRESCEDPVYQRVVSSTDKTSLDTHKSNINTAITDVVNSQQLITATKITNTTNINSAKSQVDLTEGKLEAAQAEFSRIIASAREEDVDLYKIQLKQAKAQLELLKNQIKDTLLKSPANGQIIKINKKAGEIVQPMLQQGLISLLPSTPFEIETDIYEEDVVKIDIGNPVDIFLVAFPDRTFKGKVISINPTQKLIGGVVYYEVIIGSALELGNWMPEKVKPGMTADVVIITAFKENVLIISKNAIQKEDDKLTVQVFKNEIVEEREIKIGLEGSNDMIEIISGLIEGEKIILK